MGVSAIEGQNFSYRGFGGGFGAGNESGAYSVYFTDMVIIGANGEVHPLYTGQPSASVNYVGAANMTGLAESIGQNITNGESHFYLSDDLNSVRMVLGGWPLSESTYTPFGQEVNATISGYNNTYKFTGMEQDAETDLDHTWFRQYASVQGRWMSPDPYNGSYDIANPQSFNRYGYVNNSPTTAFDPSGLHSAECYGIKNCNPGLFWGGGELPGSSWSEFDMMAIPVWGYGFGFIPLNVPMGTAPLSNGYMNLTMASMGFGFMDLGTGYLWEPLDASNVPSYNGATAPSKTTPPTNFDYWKQDMETCLGIAGQTFANDMNPFTVGLGTAASITSSMSQASAEGAAMWSVQQGLTVPLRSSIVRAGMANAETLGEVSGWLSVVGIYYAAGDAVYAEAKGCL